MRFEFATATRILFGPGAVRQVGALAQEMGRRALLVTGRCADRAVSVLSSLAAHQVETVEFALTGEPTIEAVTKGAQRARDEGCALVVGFGGGSAVDGGKAIAALAANPGDPLDYLEVIGHGKPLPKASLPFIAVPTTAGTGAEVTRNAVLASPHHRVKVSLRSPLMLPKLAVVDPELTHSLPPSITASTGLDALTQLIEPFVSVRANPITDALCAEGIGRVGRSLLRAYQDGGDASAREDMALASLLSGLALANAGLGAVHGFAAPIGGMFSAPHGAVCAALLPHVMEVNLRALQERLPMAPFLQRYDQVAQWVVGNPEATAADGVGWVRELCSSLRIPSLRGYGISAADLPGLAEKARMASSMKGNPIELTTDELLEILDRAL